LRAKIDREFTVQCNAIAAWIANSTAVRFRTGSAPGIPRQMGHTLVFGGAPKLVGHPQKILVRVASWTCTSSPMTGSYLAMRSAGAMFNVVEDKIHYINLLPRPGISMDSSLGTFEIENVL
jgi:hypothetical protein